MAADDLEEVAVVHTGDMGTLPVINFLFPIPRIRCDQ